MEFSEYVSLAQFSSMQLGGSGRYLTRLQKQENVSEMYALAEELAVDVHILGGGSNTIFADGVVDKLIVKNELTGIERKQEGEGVLLTVGAGENWDDLVAHTVEHEWSGLAVLSGIPGSVGAAPVQNIGAYGAELSDVLVSVTAFDRQRGKLQTLAASDCDFGYRTSRFKKEGNRWLVASITLAVSPEPAADPEYGSLQNYLNEENIENPDVAEIRAAVLAVRSRRLPSIAEHPNAGSFFVNPVVATTQADKLEEQFPDLVRYDLAGGRTKIPAGWLIEAVGLKGETFGNFKTSPDNALVLIHHGEGTTAELLSTQKEIQRAVQEKFSITLEREPRIVG